MAPRKRPLIPARLSVFIAVVAFFVLWHVLGLGFKWSSAPATVYKPHRGASFKSQFRCESLDAHATEATVEVLGKRLSSYHYCVVRDACIDITGRLHMFDSDLASPKEYDFPKVIGKLPRKMIMTPDTTALKTLQRQGKYYNGTSVLLAHESANVGSNPAYTMEALGTLHAAYKKLMKKGCKVDDLSCVGSVREVTALGWLAAEDWAQYATRIAVDDSIPSNMKFTSNGGLRERCYEKLLVPGYHADIWPNAEVASDWSQHAQDWVSQAKVKENKEKSIVKSKDSRVLLLGARFFRRRIADPDLFQKLLAFTLKKVNAELRIIECLRHTFMSQWSNIQEADIFLSMHGADLTNLAWFPQGRGITIEMNPLWFFEPRYRKMSQLLGQKHYAVTCNSHECAFGGGRRKFESHLSAITQISYDWDSHEVRTGALEKFKWPAVMLPDSEPCTQCAHLQTTEGKEWLRLSMDSNVAMMPLAHEFVAVLAHAFESLGWLPSHGPAAVESFVDATIHDWKSQG